MHIYVDASDVTFVGLCACGTRVLAFSHESALAQLAEHESRAHRGEKNARWAFAQYRHRHAAKPTSAA